MRLKNRLLKTLYSATSAVVISVLAGVGTLSLVLGGGTALAYGEVTTRSIEMSNSAISATSVSYDVTFTAATGSTNIQAFAVDFCSNDPIIGDSCTAPTAFSVASAGVTGASIAGESGGTWTAGSANSGRTFELTDSSASGSLSTGSPSTFTITGVSNTSTLGTFYARIFTFTSSSNMSTWAAYSSGNGSDTTGFIDAGGIALSTANQITVTSKVQEQITFCIATSLPNLATGSCTGATGVAVTLGDSHGVLSTSDPFVDKSTGYIIGTNASNGATVRMTGTTLTSPSSTIPAVNSGSSTPATVAADTSAFGLCTYTNASGPGTLSSISSTYNGGGGTNCSGLTSTSGGSPASTGSTTFGYNTTAMSGTYGDTLASVAAGLPAVGDIAFVGSISTTQPAGIYTTTITFIATGSY